MFENINKYEIKVDDDVLLNNDGITEIFGNDISAPLFGKVIEVDDKTITYGDSSTNKKKTCLTCYLKKGKPNMEFWYAIANAFSKISEKPGFDKIVEKYPYLVEYYEALTEETLGNSKMIRSMDCQCYEKFEKYIIGDESENFDLELLKQKMNSQKFDDSNNSEIQDIILGDKVILNDYALTNVFINKIDMHLWGEVISINGKLIGYMEPETREVSSLDISQLKKGLPNKEYIYKILTVISKLENDKTAIYNIRKKGSQNLDSLLELRKEYLPSPLEKETQVKEKLIKREELISMFFQSKFSQYFQGEVLEAKIKEARQILNLLYEFTNFESDKYAGNDILLLCNYIVNTYEYDNANNKQSLKTNERLGYALVEEFSYNRLIDDFTANDDVNILYGEFLKQSPIILDEELVKDAIATSIEKFRKSHSIKDDGRTL